MKMAKTEFRGEYMISVDEIRKKAEHKFIPYLHSLLNGDSSFFPLHIPAAKGSATDDFATRKVEAENLYYHSKNKKGFGYTVVTNTMRTRSKGIQTVIDKILFETEVDFLRFIQKETEADNFKTNIIYIKTQCSLFEAADIQYDWILTHCSILTCAFAAQYWEQLFLCAHWFLHHSPCRLYLREIPLPVHTKFIEQNRALIFSLYCALKRKRYYDQSGGAHSLDIDSAPDAESRNAESHNTKLCNADFRNIASHNDHTIEGENTAELSAAAPAACESKNTAEAIYTEWGVRTAPPFIRFRLLDTAIGVTLAGTMFQSDEVQLPLESFAALNFKSIDTLFIIENVLVYLTFPAVPNSLCIFGAGFAAVQLQCNTHLQHKKMYYFGDIDEHGFEILSDFRAIFPNVTSFCMDSCTYQTFSHFAVPGKSSKRDSASLHLTAEELALFRFLQGHPNRGRLEQERIPQSFIQERLVH